jgi:hypothetical protein
MSTMILSRALFVVGLSASLSPSIQGMDLSEYDRLAAERTQLMLEENRLKGQTADLEMLSVELGAIRFLQNERLAGQQGLKVRYERWLANAEQWLAQWKSLAELSQSITPDNIGTFGAEVQNALQRSNQNYANLAREAYELYEQAGSLEVELKTRADIEPSRWGQNGSFVTALNEQKKRSLATLATLRNQLDPKRIESIRQDVSQVQRLIETRLTQMVVDFPELREKVALVRGQLRIIAEIEPILAGLESRANRLIGVIDDGYLQIAQLELADLKRAQDPVLGRIRSLEADESFKAQLIRRAQQTTVKTQRALDEQLETASQRSQFVNLVLPKRISLSKICRERGQDSKIDCELLRVLNQVPVSSQSVQKWTTADLLYFETKLYQVENGVGRLPEGVKQK